jgi:hypothetical protein
VVPDLSEKLSTANGVKMAYDGLVIEGGQMLTWEWEEAMVVSLVFQVRPKNFW